MFLCFLQMSLTSLKWWSVVKEKSADVTLSENFSKFCEFLASLHSCPATDLHSCPATSTSIERWFSTLGYIWTKTRNQFGSEKAKKLVKIYKALHNPDELVNILKNKKVQVIKPTIN